MANDYYADLSVSRNADQAEIKRAYRKLARELHPDVNPDPETQEHFKRITAAYEVLSDPQKRAMYDRGVDPRAPGGGQPGGFGFSDLMDAFFGQSAPRGPRPRHSRGKDALIRVDVSLEEVVAGTERELMIDSAVTCDECGGQGTARDTQVVPCTMCRGRGEVQSVQRSFLGQVMTSHVCPQCKGFGSVIPHPCAACAGEGRVRTRRTIGVRIPAGVSTGTRIHLADQGEAGHGGGPRGDLFVEIVEKPHGVFTRNGDDLHCLVSLPMTVAALGAQVPLTTLDGTEELNVPAGTQSGYERSLRGRGVPHLRGAGRGDLVVHVEVVTPTRLDAEQRSLLEQLARIRREDQPVAVPVERHAGLFGRLKDAFTGR